MSNLPFVEEILADLRRFKECAEDDNDVYMERSRFDLLVQLGLLERIQRSPARWMMTQAGEDAIALAAAGEPVAPKPIGYISKHAAQDLANGCLCTITPDRMMDEGQDWEVPVYAAPPAAAHGDEAVRKDAERLDFILTKCRKVVVEMLPRGRDVYVEEGVMGERTYPAIHRDKDWPAGSAEDFALKRQAIDAAMRAQGDGGGA